MGSSSAADVSAPPPERGDPAATEREPAAVGSSAQTRWNGASGTDLVGRVLGGRYRITTALGGGASAAVFAADDDVLSRAVAVKILHPALTADESLLRRFQAQARMAAALRHPNVLQVHDWGDDQGTFFFVTELLEGGSLKRLLDRGFRATPAHALQLGFEACRGLDHAHRRGVVHRGVKPAKLLLDGDGHLRVADFGIAPLIAAARAAEPLTAAVGAAHYASPEQVEGRPTDGRSDVYSLALVLIEAMTGEVPSTAETSAATLLARLERPVETPSDVGPLAEALAAALRTEREGRSDAATFGRMLKAAAARLDRPGPLPLLGPASLGDGRPAAHPGTLDRPDTRPSFALGTVGDSGPTASSAPDDVVVTRALRKVYPGGRVAVEALDLSVRRGEIFGLLGPNGAGKSTTVGMLTTRIIPTSGSAVVNGIDVVAQPALAKQVIGVVSQANTLDQGLNVWENLYFHGRYFGLGDRAARSGTDELLERFRLGDRRTSEVEALSGGMARRLMVARALLHRPTVIFLDEPTIGLDPQSRIALWEVLVELQGEGQTVLVTTHHMDEADEHCDRLAIVDHGRILAVDTPEGLKASKGSGASVSVRTEDNLDGLAAHLARVDGVTEVRVVDDEVRLNLPTSERAMQRILAAAQAGGFHLTDLSVGCDSLETVFVNLTGKDLRD